MTTIVDLQRVAEVQFSDIVLDTNIHCNFKSVFL